MLPFFSYLRDKAREAVLAGVQDALDQIDPVLTNRTPVLSTPSIAASPVPQLNAAESVASPHPTEAPPVTSPPAAPQTSGGLQERLAQATNSIGLNNTAINPPKPSSPKRGRGRPGEGNES